MIHLITLNPAIDHFIYINQIASGKTNYAENDYLVFGGKAINVAHVLRELNCKCRLITTIDNNFDKLIKSELSGIDAVLFNVNKVRVNTKIVSASQVTEINSKGESLSNTKTKFIDYVQKNVESDDIVLIAGNAHSEDYTFLIELANLVKCKTNKLIIDSANVTLADLEEIKPYAIKPNQEEISKILNLNFTSEQELIKNAKKIVELGVENVIVSQGASGSVFINEKQKLKISGIKGDVINAVGAGDSFIAGYLYSLVNNTPIETGLKLATACATATTFSSGLAKFSQIKKQLPKVKINKIID